MKQVRPSLWLALVPVVALVVSLYFSIRIFDISPHISLITAAVVAAGIAVGFGASYAELEKGVVRGISVAMPSILILMAIGILIGTWTSSGVVPYLIALGLELLSPSVFLPACCVICIIVSLSTGSSWSTAGTVGVALIGVGQGLGFSLPMVAGAVISGAYFGDKMSPLSETTNLAPAVAGAKLIEHIRHMAWTSGPSILISLVLYTVIGLSVEVGTGEGQGIEGLASKLDELYQFSPWLLLAPVGVLALILLRVPALPAVLGGGLIGIVLGVWIQDRALVDMLVAAQSGFVMESGVAEIDELLSRGGLESMFWTISLIVCSMAFGGVMESSGMLRVIAERLLSAAKSGGQLVAATVGTCLGMNLLAPDQYLSIIVPGKMYQEAYAKKGLAAKNLSRALEDGGTVTSPLVPWNSCGVFMFSVLLVSPMAYLPYAFFNLLSPVISVIVGLKGWTIEKSTPEQDSSESRDA
ncbi:Na+/H+ antiporter NhaC [Pelagicoccus mobilis]|uniref:Na+/H+ antiporter NhaC n=1 Tax=Pelagicoccus mobilis TaxID=415221 RepID=A0A934RXL3_9BACT|nr:Na+/H+ antiporter NhaC [Pelagicoccus mobilis]MBK1876676.1 Na+/H+ antiporter NhaC [Pelagicoccus mobilis]